MNTHEWKLQFRQHCLEERDRYTQLAEMLEGGVFHLFENQVDISAEWAERNRRIAKEMDDLIAKIDEDVGNREE